MTSHGKQSGRSAKPAPDKRGSKLEDSRKGGDLDSNPAGSSASAQIQGEGDYRAAERYDQSARAFAESGKVDEAARQAKPGSAAEEQAMREAERSGLSHTKGEDPALPHAARGKEDKR